MKIVIPGGSGQIGSMLARAFQGDDHDVVILTRRPRKSRARRPREAFWDGETCGDWSREIDGSDVVINLAGQSVNCRYGAASREKILQSRILSTRAVGRAVQNAAHPPRVWLQASTATIYSHRFDAAQDETNGVIGGQEPNAPPAWRFSIEVATAWEREALQVNVPHTRRVLLRTAVVMSPDPGGALNILLNLVRFGLGGKNGDGRQFVSWIHDRDFCRAVQWLVEHPVEGVVNLAAPEPLPNDEFMRTLRKAWGIRFGLPASRWMLEIGALLLRTETELILKSRRVIPARLLQAGFDFEFPDWQTASLDLCRRWREHQSP